jgi:hypothetical protein
MRNSSMLTEGSSWKKLLIAASIATIAVAGLPAAFSTPAIAAAHGGGLGGAHGAGLGGAQGAGQVGHGASGPGHPAAKETKRPEPPERDRAGTQNPPAPDSVTSSGFKSGK